MTTSDILDLLNAIRTRLQSEITAVRDASVILLSDLDTPVFPQSLVFPAIGISDGDIDETPEIQDGYDQVIRVDVAAYVQIFTDDEAALTNAKNGVFALEAAIKTALNNYTSVLSGCYLAVVDKRFKTRKLFSDTDMAVMKKIRFKYNRILEY